MKPYYFLFLILPSIFFACSLNSEQEKNLNTALSIYLNARNSGEATLYVACTHPDAVAYYTAQGDSIFKTRYNLANIEEQAYLQDANLLEIKTEGTEIHVRYSLLSIREWDVQNPSKEVFLFAISQNDGKSWFFIDEEDYFSDAIFNIKKRLFKQ